MRLDVTVRNHCISYAYKSHVKGSYPETTDRGSVVVTMLSHSTITIYQDPL